jgi:hypothetical protein
MGSTPGRTAAGARCHLHQEPVPAGENLCATARRCPGPNSCTSSAPAWSWAPTCRSRRQSGTSCHTLRLRCTSALMAEIQLELGRFHPACVPAPLPLGAGSTALGDPWRAGPAALVVLLGAGLLIEAPASLQAERLHWLAAHQLPGADPSGTSVQTKAMVRDAAEAERKRLRLRKRIGPSALNSSKHQ